MATKERPSPYPGAGVAYGRWQPSLNGSPWQRVYRVYRVAPGQLLTGYLCDRRQGEDCHPERLVPTRPPVWRDYNEFQSVFLSTPTVVDGGKWPRKRPMVHLPESTEPVLADGPAPADLAHQPS